MDGKCELSSYKSPYPRDFLVMTEWVRFHFLFG